MKTALISRKVITALITVVILTYFMMRTTSPKIIFAPFLLCAISSIGKNFALLINKNKLALFFDVTFKIVFFLSWFGFLTVVCYVIIKEGNYSKLLFTLPYWLAGIFFVTRKFKSKKKRKNSNVSNK